MKIVLMVASIVLGLAMFQHRVNQQTRGLDEIQQFVRTPLIDGEFPATEEGMQEMASRATRENQRYRDGVLAHSRALFAWE